ncbi:MAG: hypothetical protein ACO3J2_04845 [Chthoniobacterales bacterium]
MPAKRLLATILLVTMAVAPRAGAIDIFGRKKEDKSSARASLLQQEVMDFSDAYSLAIGQEVDKYIRGQEDPQKRLAAETWKTLFSAAAMGIAAGRDPSSNLLDMYVFMRLTSDATRRYWVPEVFGDDAAGINAANAKLLGELEGTLLEFIDAAQKEEIDAMIGRWRGEHSDMVYVAGIRLRDLAELRSRRAGVRGGPIPVLADMQKAVGEVDAAVQVAERMMFYLERLPHLAAMQTSLALAQAGAAPAILSVTESAENASQALASLPGALNESVATNAVVIKEILPEVRISLEATREVLAAAERLTSTESGGETWEKGDVMLALDGLTGSAREINATLQQAEGLLARATQPETAAATASLLHEVQESGAGIVDRAYYRGLQLLLLLLAGQALIIWVVLRARRG